MLGDGFIQPAANLKATLKKIRERSFVNLWVSLAAKFFLPSLLQKAGVEKCTNSKQLRMTETIIFIRPLHAFHLIRIVLDHYI